MNQEIEVAPGVFFSGKNGQHKLVIKASTEEVVAWDFEEIKRDPQEWFNSLSIISLAIQHGPTIAYRRIKEAKAEKQTPVGSLHCNVCNIKFVVAPGHHYIFTAKLNGKSFCDYQCSDICHRLRKEMVFRTELGENFIDDFPKTISNPRTKNA